jgi:glyoxylase-like metal-dependent hydrolase (beta-lactamase superfamily II)
VAGRVVEAIHTPGHTRGHFVYRDAIAGVLFAGDHVLPHITPSIGFEPIRTTSPLRDYLASLALMREMPDTLLLPAHGPATISVHERVDQLLHHHAQRLDLTLEAVSRGASTAGDVAHQWVWTSRGTRFSDMDPYNSMLAVLETAAHLEVLVERDLVKVTDIDGVRHYTT